MADRAEVNLEITHDNILAGYSSAGVGVDHTSAMTDAFLEYLTVTIYSGGNDVSFDIHHSLHRCPAMTRGLLSTPLDQGGPRPSVYPCGGEVWRWRSPAYCHTEKKAL